MVSIRETFIDVEVEVRGIPFIVTGEAYFDCEEAEPETGFHATAEMTGMELMACVYHEKGRGWRPPSEHFKRAMFKQLEDGLLEAVFDSLEEAEENEW